MANEAITNSFEITTLVSDFQSYVSSRDKTNLAYGNFVRGSQNVYKTLGGTIANRPGEKRRGAINTAQSRISSEYVWKTSWGAEYVLIVADSKLQVEYDGVFYTLLDSLTRTRYVFDKWFDNIEKKDRVLFVNGSSDMFDWSGGIAVVNAQAVGGATLTKTGAISWQQAGFSVTSGQKTFTINGSPIVYTYTGGESTTTLTGITPALPAIAQDTVILQSVLTETNKPSANFSADFIKVINNQVYVGSYTSRLCYISSNTDFTNFTVPTPRIAGSPELLTLDAPLKGIGVRQGNAYIGIGTGAWAVVTFQDITVGTTLTQSTKVDVKPQSLLRAPYAHEFIDTVGDTLIFLSQDQQLCSYGQYSNLFTQSFPSLSQQVATELTDENFNLGGLRCIGEFVYLTAPASGRMYLYQVRETLDVTGQVVAERLWHAPWVSNFTRVDEIGGIVYGFSNANPQIYQIWDTDQFYDDSPQDEQLPYKCVLAMPYFTVNSDLRGTQKRYKLVNFDKVYTEGYIDEGTPLNVTVNYNFQGAENTIVDVVNSSSRPAFSAQGTDAASLGDSSIGDEPLGDSISIDDEDGYDLPKFRCINSLNLIDCFEYQVIYSSEAVGAQWQILALGTNARESTQDPIFIINK